MSNFSKVVKGGLCLALVGSLAACSDDDEDSSSSAVASSMSSAVVVSSAESSSVASAAESSAVSSEESSSEMSSSDMTMSSSDVSVSSSSSDAGPLVISLESGWRTNPDTVTMSYVTGGVQFEPTANGDQLVFDLATPFNANGLKITYEFEVDDAFLESDAAIQPIFQEKQDFTGHWDCWIGAPETNVGTHICEIDATGWDITHDKGIQFGFQIPGADNSPAPAGVVTITSVTIELPE